MPILDILNTIEENKKKRQAAAPISVTPTTPTTEPFKFGKTPEEAKASFMSQLKPAQPAGRDVTLGDDLRSIKFVDTGEVITRDKFDPEMKRVHTELLKQLSQQQAEAAKQIPTSWGGVAKQELNKVRAKLGEIVTEANPFAIPVAYAPSTPEAEVAGKGKTIETLTAEYNNSLLGKYNHKEQIAVNSFVSGLTGGIIKPPTEASQGLADKVVGGVASVAGMVISIKAIGAAFGKLAAGSATIGGLLTKYPLVAKYAYPLVKNIVAFDIYGQLDPDTKDRFKKLAVDTITAIPYTGLGYIPKMTYSIPASFGLGYGLAKMNGASNEDAIIQGGILAVLDMSGRIGNGEHFVTGRQADRYLQAEAINTINQFSDIKITANSSPEEVKNAYYNAAHQTHPDKGGNPENFKAVTEAYNYVSGQPNQFNLVSPFAKTAPEEIPEVPKQIPEVAGQPPTGETGIVPVVPPPVTTPIVPVTEAPSVIIPSAPTPPKIPISAKIEDILTKIEQRVQEKPVEVKQKITKGKAVSITEPTVTTEQRIAEIKDKLYDTPQEADTKITSEGAKSIYKTPYSQFDYVVGKIMNGEPIPPELNNLAVQIWQDGGLTEVPKGQGSEINLEGMFMETAETVNQPKVYSYKFLPSEEGGFDKATYEDIYGKSLDEVLKMNWQDLQQGSGIQTNLKAGDAIQSIEIPETKVMTKGKNAGNTVDIPGYGIVENIYDNGRLVALTKNGYQEIDFFNAAQVVEDKLTPNERVKFSELRNLATTPEKMKIIREAVKQGKPVAKGKEEGEVKRERYNRKEAEGNFAVWIAERDRAGVEYNQKYPTFEPKDFDLDKETNLVVQAGDYIIDRDGHLNIVTHAADDGSYRETFFNTKPVTTTGSGGTDGKPELPDWLGLENQERMATADELKQVGLDPALAKPDKFITEEEQDKIEQEKSSQREQEEYNETEEELYNYAVVNEKKIIGDYIKEFGNYLGGDNVKEMFPLYMESPAEYYMQSRRGSNYIREILFQKFLKENKGKGNDEVLILMGGPASGKTVSVKQLKGENYQDNYAFILEVTGHDQDILAKTKQTIRDNGYAIRTIHIYADIDTAFPRMLNRAENNGDKKDGKGRTVYIPEYVKRHLGAVELSKKYLQDQSDIDDQHTVATNFGKQEDVKELTTQEAIDLLSKSRYNKGDEDNLINKFYGQTIKTLESKGISQAIYEGTTGLSGTMEQKQFGQGKISSELAKEGPAQRRGNKVVAKKPTKAVAPAAKEGVLSFTKTEVSLINNSIKFLDASVSKTRLLKEDELEYEYGDRYALDMSLYDSLGERGYNYEFTYKEKPTGDQVAEDLVEYYQEEKKTMEEEELAMGIPAHTHGEDLILDKITEILDRAGMPTKTPGGIPIEYRKAEERRGLAIQKEAEFKVGEVFNTKGHSNMVSPVTIREITGNTIKFTDAEGTDFAGMQRSLLRTFIKENHWERIQQPTQKEAVKEAVKEVPKTIKEIAEETQILEPNIRRILGVGTKEGTFERVDKGVYVLRKGGKDIAVVYPGDARKILPKLVSEGFKADMIFLDIPYDTPAVKGGNRPMGYDFISVPDFKKIVESVKAIAKSEDSAVFYMYSQAPSGLKKMAEYNNVMTDAGFIPLAKGNYKKLTKEGKPFGFPTPLGWKPLEPEGIILFNQSGNNIAKAPVNLDFELERPKGWKSEKPAEMLRDLIKMTTEEGETILDPFAGSGVTLAEAVRAGRKAVGVEISEEAVKKHIVPKVEEAAKAVKVPTGEKVPNAHLYAKLLMVKNPNLPILNEFNVKDGVLNSTDLEIGLKLNTTLPDGMYRIVGKDAVKSTTPADDFPIIPELKGKVSGKIMNEFLADGIKKANVSRSDSYARPEIGGVSISIDKNKMTIASTDSFRLYQKTLLMKGNNIQTKFIVGATEKLVKVLPSIGPLAEVYEDNEYIHFVGNNGSITVRKVEGDYPDYKVVFPEIDTQYEFTRKDFINALKEVKPYVDRTKSVIMSYKKTSDYGGEVTLKAENKEQNIKKEVKVTATKRSIPVINKGSANDGVIVMEIKDEYKPEGGWALNVSFAIDSLNSLEEDRVFMYPSKDPDFQSILFSTSDKLESKPIPPEEKKEVVAPSGMASTATGKLGEFENVVPTPADEMKIYEKVKELITKYAKSIGQGYTPRNAIGVFFPDTTNIRIKGMNDLSVASHEIAHFLDDAGLISKQVMQVVGQAANGNPLYAKDTRKIRIELTDLYEKYYPGAKRTHKLSKRMTEGFATLLQKITEMPTTITTTYPNVVRDFLTPKGRFYKPVMGEILNDLSKIVSEYQGLKPLDKIGARIVSEKIHINKGSFMNFADKVKTEILDNVFPIKKLAMVAGKYLTKLDPSIWIRQYNNSNALITNNIFGKRGYWSWRNGDLVKILDYNWADLIKAAKNDRLTDQFGSYLVARRVYYEYEQLNKLDEKDPERIWLKQVIDHDGITEKEAFDVYTQNKDMFKKYEDMYDALVAEDLKFLHDPEVQLVDNESYDKLSSKEGYASFKRVFYDEIVGDAEGYLQPKKGTTKASSLIRRTGSQRPILHPLDSGVLNHAEITRKALKQMVYNKIGQLSPNFPDLFQRLQLKAIPDIGGRLIFPQEKDPNIIMARISYHRIPILTDKLIKRTVDEVLNAQNLHLFEKLLMGSSRFFTKGTTGLFPAFSITNYTRDQITAVANTRNNYIPIYDPLRQIISLMKPENPAHASFMRYMVAGGERQTIVGWQDKAPNELFDLIADERNGLLKVVDGLNKGMDILALPAKWSEIMTRWGEFYKSEQAGKPTVVALEEAGMVTAPFHHIGRWGGGRVGQTWIRSLPFFNPGIQVLAQAAEQLTTSKATRSRYLFTALAITAASIASLLLLLKKSSDDQKRELADLHPDELAAYIWYPLPSGKGLGKIPVGSSMGFIAALINMAVIDKTLDAHYTAGEYLNAGTSFLPQQLDISQPARMLLNWIPQVIKPGALTLMGMKDYPTIMPLEGASLSSREPGLRFYEYTSPVAKWLGKQFNLSPVKIDYLLTGYVGRASGFLTGKPGIYNPFSSLTRDYYFESGRKLQQFYDMREKNNQEYYDIRHKLKSTTHEHWADVLTEREKLKVITNLMDTYKDIDVEKAPKTAEKYRGLILKAVDQLYEK